MDSEFLIYHKNRFNPELAPADFSNYKIQSFKSPLYWTQIRFAAQIWKDKPDVLWMPMQTLPFIRRNTLKTVVTIHDLAFKYFPDNFPAGDSQKLNYFTDYAIYNSDKIISVSESTKQDILKFFPKIPPEKIMVIHHGFDSDIFSLPRDIGKESEIKKRLSITGDYLLYVGAIQPRKNLIVLIEAFELLKKDNPSLQLILVGERAWKWDKIIAKAGQSPYKKDIVMPGRLKFDDLGHIMRGALVFILPSIYEGFGIPVLEAFASGIPVILAENSSLMEVGGKAAKYFKTNEPADLAAKIRPVLLNKALGEDLVIKGFEQIKNFSWEKCAKETLDYLKS